MENDIYLKIFINIRQQIRLALRLLQIRPPAGVEVFITNLKNYFPYPLDIMPNNLPDHKFFNIEQQFGNFKNSLATIEQRLLSELSEILQNQNNQAAINIELKVSMRLDAANSVYREDSDNIFLNICVSLEDLCPGLSNKAFPNQDLTQINLYDFLLQNAIPAIKPRDLLRSGSIWVDIIIHETMGYKLQDKAQRAILLHANEITQLLRQERNLNFGDTEIIANSRDNELIQDFQRLLEKVDKFISCNFSNAQERDILFQEILALLRDYKNDDWLWKSDCRGRLTHNKWPDWNKFNIQHYAAMKCLDDVMRQIELWTLERIASEKALLKIKNTSPKTWVGDCLYPLEIHLTFWTKKEGFSSPTRFYQNGCGSIGLFNDGEDWHETHPYKPMCYLSHVAFVDGFFPYTELEYIDYITWEFTCIRQLIADIDPATQKIKGEFPSRDYDS